MEQNMFLSQPLVVIQETASIATCAFLSVSFGKCSRHGIQKMLIYDVS